MLKFSYFFHIETNSIIIESVYITLAKASEEGKGLYSSFEGPLLLEHA